MENKIELGKVEEVLRQIQKVSVIGIVAAEDGEAAVEQEEENEDEEECDAEGGAAEAVEGVGFAGGEEGGDEGAPIGGEELNGEKEKDGQKE